MGKLLLYGSMLLLVGLLIFVVASILFSLGTLIQNLVLASLATTLYFSSSIIAAIFLICMFIDSGISSATRREFTEQKNTKNLKAIVGIAAYNEEQSIEGAVHDFKSIPFVSKVIVIDNNSKDRTNELAKKAGAEVVIERVPGYASTCIRALKECLARAKKDEIIVLVEGDGTFSAQDLYKMMSYIGNIDMVVGTRLCPEIVDRKTQLNWFYIYGNYFLAKLLHLKYYLRLTDVGCTYRAIRPEALRRIIDKVKVTSGHAFSPHMINVAAASDLLIVEIPITFHKRIGVSKGAGGNYRLAIKTGLKMWGDILFN